MPDKPEGNMGYYTDLKSISTDDYKAILKSADLLPSRMVLKENIDTIFDIFKNHNLQTAADIQSRLKNKKKIQDFSNTTGIPEDYLTILVRELNSCHPKPNLIKDFPDVPDDVTLKLEKVGIKNTLQLFDRVLTPLDRAALSEQTGIEAEQLTRLTRLTDLSRIRWVNHTFAVMLLEAGYDSAEKVARADCRVLHQKVKALNENRNFYKGTIGLHDIKLCVEAARDVSKEIVYS